MTSSPITYTEILNWLHGEAQRLDIVHQQLDSPQAGRNAEIARAAHRIVADHRDHKGVRK